MSVCFTQELYQFAVVVPPDTRGFQQIVGFQLVVTGQRGATTPASASLAEGGSDRPSSAVALKTLDHLGLFALGSAESLCATRNQVHWHWFRSFVLFASASASR